MAEYLDISSILLYLWNKYGIHKKPIEYPLYIAALQNAEYIMQLNNKYSTYKIALTDFLTKFNW